MPFFSFAVVICEGIKQKTEKKKNALLTEIRLRSLNLQTRNVNFIIEQGSKYFVENFW